MPAPALPQEIVDRASTRTGHLSPIFPADANRKQICEHVATRHDTFDSRYRLSLPIVEEPEDASSQLDLARLRLASRTTCEGANPHFFRRFNAKLPNTDRPMPPPVWRKEMVEFSQRPWTRHVQRLSLGFSGDSGLSQSHEREALVAALYAVPAFVRACGKLKAVEFIFGRANMRKVLKERPLAYELLLGMIENALHECPPSLQALELLLPNGSMFEKLSMNIAGDSGIVRLLSRLEVLSVSIRNANGNLGPSRWSTLGRDQDFMDDYAESQAGVWNFISQHTPALRGLIIHCHPTFDMDPLPPPSTATLRELLLSNVRAGHLRLQHQAKSTSLRALALRNVWLTSGTWEDVLSAFAGVGTLTSFVMVACGYSKNGASALYHADPSWYPYVPRCIETKRAEDGQALRRLMEAVNARRAEKSMEVYGNLDDPCAELP